MKLTIIAVGKKMPTWVTQAFESYQRRFSCPVRLIEVNVEKRSKNANIQAIMLKESEKILKHISPKDYVIALDEHGQPWSTKQLAEKYTQWESENLNVCLLIGGPDGLAKICKQRANATWSLGALVFPHPLVRIILIEQLYRAYSITINHPYHRE